MTPPPADDRRRVELRIAGDVSGLARWLFGDVRYVVEPITTTVVGEVGDDQELADLCHRIRDSGLELLSLRTLPGDALRPEATPGQDDAGPAR